MSSTARIAAVRRFTRFYTRKVGILDQHILASPFSLSEARVLYELANHENLSATDLGARLGIDAGYLSRILADFVRRGFVRRHRSANDGRERHLELTTRGQAAFMPLDRGSQAQVQTMLTALTDPQQRRLVDAMRTVEALLAPAGSASASEPAYTLRTHRPGDMGWIIYRQEMLYHEEYGWNEEFEALIAGILSRFITNFDPARERCWIAEREGEIIASVFVVKKSAAVAQLRMLYVEPRARGLGIGRRLVDECIAFARKRNYRKMILWTNSVLTSARRIYEVAGFRLVKEETHRSFGKKLIGQYWELGL
jgi:DNA-binding MarR family transcriptional regulator/GNAT superfamily N-acetyltransferase